MAGNTDVGHSKLAVRGADTATNVMESIMAYWIPDETVLFTGIGFFQTSIMGCVTNAAAIRCWFTAVGPLMKEAFGAFLPADGSITTVSFFALVVAEEATLVCVFGEPAIARSDWFSYTAAVGKFPASLVDLNGKQYGESQSGDLAGLEELSGSPVCFF